MARINWKLFLAIYVVTVALVCADDDDDDVSMTASMASMDMSASSYSSDGTSLCNDEVSVFENNTVTDGAYFSSCVNGTTYNISTLFDLENLTSSEFLTWCKSESCLTPVHRLLDYMPQNCEVVYDGVKQNLYEEVSSIHAKCHAVKDAAAAASAGSTASASSSNKSSSTVGTTSGVAHVTYAGLVASAMAAAVTYLLV